MLSFEESGKAIILVDYAKKQQIISKTAWLKKLCSHVKKNLACYKLMWEEANISEIFEGQQASTSKFQQDWKNVYTYVDYDFKNKKWTSPIDPKTFLNTGNSKAFSYSALLNAARALEVVNKKITEYKFRNPNTILFHNFQ